MKDKVAKQLEHAPVTWSIFDSTLVVTLVSEKFVKLEDPRSTRFGEEKN